nr:MAG TPA: hypothetical protein [Caudoviricetes sp.]
MCLSYNITSLLIFIIAGFLSCDNVVKKNKLGIDFVTTL